MSYELGEEELNQRFANDILTGLLSGEPQPQQHPRMLIVAGQPGAGKSYAERALVRDLDIGAAINVDADDLRPYHPAYRALAVADDRTADRITHPAAAAWAERALRYAIRQRFNIVYSTPMGDPERVQWLADLVHDTGYRIDIAFVAVDSARSKLAILHRYQRSRDSVGAGRIVPFEYHDRQYVGLLDTATLIEGERSIDSVSVYSRDGIPLYRRSLGESTPAFASTASDAIITERMRPWSRIETATFRSVAGWLGRTGRPRSLPPHLMPEHQCSPLAADLRPLLAEVVADGLAHLRRAPSDANPVRVAYPPSAHPARVRPAAVWPETEIGPGRASHVLAET
ncbi:zeta toxin family protein [Hamadaea tsunoensis]|uniref:zeta toxin family protein n=1 Tax=Hamadaea tsunoensis TaxID=53368 RepID=UPI000411D418|nr:zeta toxin family protein [Hamadaea tsunoensis]